MPPPAPTYPLTDADSIKDLLSDLGLQYKLDDNSSGSVDVAEDRTDRAVGVGTSWVFNRLGGLYDPVSMQSNWSCWYWATLQAIHWLCMRRMQTPSSVLEEELKRCDEEMQMVRNGELTLDIPMRAILAPGVDNYRIDGRFWERQLRRQGALSDKTPVRHKVNRDVLSDILVEPFS
jgi:hypothetical protein